MTDTPFEGVERTCTFCKINLQRKAQPGVANSLHQFPHCAQAPFSPSPVWPTQNSGETQSHTSRIILSVSLLYTDYPTNMNNASSTSLFPPPPSPFSAFFPRCTPSRAFVRFWERNQPPWQIALSRNGRQLALASNAALEVYANDSPGEPPRLVTSVLERSGDGASASATHNEWRRLAWSDDGQLLVVVAVGGEGRLYTAGLDLICLLPATVKEERPPRPLLLPLFDHVDPAACPAGVAVRPSAGSSTRRQVRPHLVYVLSLNGELSTLSYSSAAHAPDGDGDGDDDSINSADGATSADAVAGTAQRLGRPLQLAALGLTSASGMALLSSANLLLVGGTVMAAQPMKSQVGIAVWRLTDTLETEGQAAGDLPYATPVQGCLPKVINLPDGTLLDADDQILRLVPSPQGDQIAILLQRGSLLLLSVPSLTVLAYHSSSALVRLRRILRVHPIATHADDARQDGPFDVCWWDDVTLALSDSSGTTQLVNARTLDVRTTESTQQLPSLGRAPQLVGGALDDNGMPRVHLLNASLAPAQSTGPADGGAVPAGSTILRSLYATAQAITRSRYFAPPEAAYMRYTYTLSTVTAVQPAELMEQLMEQGEYAVALELAQEYGLNADPIYRAQWLKEPVSLFTVRDLLRRMGDKMWTIQEALQSAPPDLATGQALYQHVLSLTTKDRVLKAARDLETSDNTDGRGNDEDGETQLSPAALSSSQARLIAARLTALQQRDKLLTFERGLTSAEEFDRGQAWDFVHRPLVEVAAAAACDGDASRLELLIVRHGDVLCPYYLALLALLPETMPVAEYEKLLPTTSTTEGSASVLQPPPIHKWHSVDSEWTAETDWAAAPRVQHLLPAHLLFDLQTARLETELPGALRAAVDAVWPDNCGDYSSVRAAVSWAESRVQALTQLGLAEAAFELAGKLASRQLPLPESIFPELQLLVTLAQEPGGGLPSHPFSRDWLRHDCRPDDVLRLLLQGVSSAQEMLDGLRQRVLPYLRSPVHQDATSPSKDEAIAAEIQALVQREPGALVGLLKEGHLWPSVVASVNRRASLLLEAAYSDRMPVDEADVMVDTASIMLEDDMHPAALDSEGSRDRLAEDVRASLGNLVRHGAVARLLQRLRASQPLSEIASVRSESQARNALRALLRRSMMRPDVDWETLLVTLKQLRTSWLTTLPEDEITAAFVHAALISGRPDGRDIGMAMVPFATPSQHATERSPAEEAAAGEKKEQPAPLLSRLTRLVEGGRQSLRHALDVGAHEATLGASPDESSVRSGPSSNISKGLVLQEAAATRVLLQAAYELVQTAATAEDPAIADASEMLDMLPDGKGSELRQHLRVLRALCNMGIDVS